MWRRQHIAGAALALALVSLVSANAQEREPRSCLEDDDECREQFMHPQLPKLAPRQGLVEDEMLTQYWLERGERFVAYKEATANTPQRGRAKNLIFFLGDGMSLTTLAATRVYLGNEDESLSFESFPGTGLAKTYAVDRLIPDAASAGTALLCGVKTNYGTVGVNAQVKRGDCEASKDASHHVESIAKWALDSGRDVGLITTARLTDATPAALYAHVADRNWENDREVVSDCGPHSEVEDIALQLIRGDIGSRLKVIMGGGKEQFISQEDYPEGRRQDGLNLIEEFQNEHPSNRFVQTKDELMSLDADNTHRLLGIFNDKYLKYNLKAMEDINNQQPSLTEMTEKAIELLKGNDKGYLLFIESDRIDSAHHKNKAHLALDETAELSLAVASARSLTNEEDTLIVVTSDHGQTMSISGYAKRTNNIFGTALKADDDIPYLTLSYTNGPSHNQYYGHKGGRVDPSEEDTENNIDAQFPATVPLEADTHGGEDVPVYASGPWGHLFSGVYEQSVIPYLMAFAGCFGPGQQACEN